jgi:hypothetical protein
VAAAGVVAGCGGGGEERGRQECGTVGGGGVLGAEKGRGRVWGAAASTRDGRVWGGLAPAHDGADRGRRRTDVEGPPGRGAVEGLGSGGADAGFLARCEGEGDAFFSFSCYWIGGCVWDQRSKHRTERRRTGEGGGKG